MSEVSLLLETITNQDFSRKFEQEFLNGCSLSQLRHFLLEQYGLDFDEKTFNKLFYTRISHLFTFDKQSKLWSLNEDSVLDLEKTPKESNSLSELLFDHFNSKIDEAIERYLEQLTVEDFRRIIGPIIKDCVQQEFSSKVTPAVLSNLQEFVTGLIDQLSRTQEQNLCSLIDEKLRNREKESKKSGSQL
jgi:hypothetical protein